MRPLVQVQPGPLHPFDLGKRSFVASFDRLLPCVAFAQRSENASLHSSTGVNVLPRLTSVRALREPGYLVASPASLACGRLEAGVGGRRRGGLAGAARTRGPVARQGGSGGGAATSGRRHHPGRRGDRVILAAHRRHRRRRVHRGLALLRSCHRPAPADYQDPPGSRVLLGGSWPSWTPPQTREPAPSPAGSAGPCPGSGQWLLKLGRRHHGSRLGATGRMVRVVSVRSSNNCCWSAGPAQNPLPVWLPAGR
jgi:hypothetical protein